MKINFTKKEYGALLELIYLGDWILNSHTTESAPETEAHRAVMQMLFSHAKEMGCEGLVAFGREEHFPSVALENRMMPYIDNYDGETMWQDLIMKLGARDVLRKLGAEALRTMSDEQRIEARLEAEAPWDQEFQTHGLERLVVDPNAKHTPSRRDA